MYLREHSKELLELLEFNQFDGRKFDAKVEYFTRHVVVTDTIYYPGVLESIVYGFKKKQLDSA